MKNFEEFCDEVKSNIVDMLKDRKIEKVTINTVPKNNGLILNGLIIKEVDNNISPTIYLEPYYEKYKESGNMFEVMQQIAATYENTAIDQQEFKDITKDFFDFEKIKDRVIVNMVNTKYNEELLERSPHKEVLDLSLIYKVLLDEDERGTATIRVEQSHLRNWGVTIDELSEIAVQNTYRLCPPKVSCMNDIIKEILAQDGMPQEKVEEYVSSIPEDRSMWVITNSSNCNGAFYMTDTKIMEELAEKFESDVVILPSSIHEVIAVSSELGPIENLKAMVSEVNDTQVAQEEQLSDNVYIYNAEAHKLQSEEEYEESRNANFAQTEGR